MIFERLIKLVLRLTDQAGATEPKIPYFRIPLKRWAKVLFDFAFVRYSLFKRGRCKLKLL